MPLDRYGEILTEKGAVSASRHLKHAIMQIFAQTACQNSVCSGFWKLCKIGIMRSPRFAFSRSMKILQKTWPNALSVRLRPTHIDLERVAAQTSKQANVSSHTNISRHHPPLRAHARTYESSCGQRYEEWRRGNDSLDLYVTCASRFLVVKVNFIICKGEEEGQTQVR